MLSARTAQVYASPLCTTCAGQGVTRSRRVCGCVYRAIFRVCLAEYLESASESAPRESGMLYVADFELAATRLLGGTREVSAFARHFIEQEPWSSCCHVLGIGRGRWWHWKYSTEERLGAAMVERGLFPTASYYNFGPVRHFGQKRAAAPAHN